MLDFNGESLYNKIFAFLKIILWKNIILYLNICNLMLVKLFKY